MQVIFKKKNGCLVRSFSSPVELEEFVARLRHSAIICNDAGRQIGAVWKQSGRWVWAYDPDTTAAERGTEDER